jgi:transposase
MAKITGTKEAFLELISQRGIYKRLDVSRSTVAGWKRRLAEGELLSLDKMEEILTKAGAKVVHEKIWEI